MCAPNVILYVVPLVVLLRACAGAVIPEVGLHDVTEDVGDVRYDVGDVRHNVADGRHNVDDGHHDVPDGRHDVPDGRQNDTRAYREQMVLRRVAETQRHRPCFRSREAYDRVIATTGPIPGYDRPLCYEDGTFMPRQCKGRFCYCITPDGARLGHYRQLRQHAQNMHCLCAMDQYGLSMLGMRDPFTCSHNGNYRRVQCYSTTCFCTDDRGNVLEDIDPVHIDQRRHLNCKPNRLTKSL